MSGTDYERRVEASAAFDQRHPDPSKDYGVHGVEFRFSLIGETAAISMGLSTGWLLPSTLGVDESSSAYRRALAADTGRRRLYPGPTSLHFHVASPIREYLREQEPRDCDLLAGGKCWGDVAFSGADRPFFALLKGGLDRLWEQLADELETFTAFEE